MGTQPLAGAAPPRIEMAQATAQPRMARRPIAEIVVDRIWRFFCSVRAAVYEIVALGMLVLIGTLRGSSVPNTIADYLPAASGIVKRWYAWDVFHSLVFVLLLTLISVAIAICTINRAPGIWRTIAHPTVPTSAGFLRNAETNAQFSVTGSTVATVDAVTRAMAKSGYRVLNQERGAEIHLYADRYRYAKLGTFPFHLALIMILIGGIVGARWGFRDEQFIIPEGSVRDVGHGTGLSVGLTDFRDTYREDGQPKEYRSDLVIYKNGTAVKSGSIIVNHPTSYEGVTFYQSSFGHAVSLRVTDAQGNELFNDSIPMGLFTSRLNPDSPAGVLDLAPLGLSLNVIGPDADRANRPDLDTLGLLSGQLFVQVRRQNLPAGTMPPSAVVNLGETVPLDGLNIQFVRERQFTLLQVARNPGIPIFWAAAFLLVGGLGVVFYFPHRRIRGIIGPETDASDRVTALFAPLAKRDWSGQREFRRVCNDLAAALNTVPILKQQQSVDDDGPADDVVPVQAPVAG
jgi:cytochrome c biogenesis protein